MPVIKGIKEIKVFQGYKEILEDFWGIPEWRDYGVKPMGKWLEEYKVVMLDEIPQENPLSKIGFQNEIVMNVTIGAKEFEALMLTGDGGFYSFLFKIDDFLSITTQDKTLEFIEE